MSAIWGMFCKTNQITTKQQDFMEDYYKKHCILNAIQTLHTDDFFAGCGIQHITKESQQEILPVYLPSIDTFIACDAILDNRKELIRKLKLTQNNLSDSEILIQAFLSWGYTFIKELRGIFTIAIYDHVKKSLFLCNDPIAARCLYYYSDSKILAFSTLLTPLSQLLEKKESNLLYIQDFLCAPGLQPTVNSTDTPIEGIYKLPTGTSLFYQNGQVTKHKYYDPNQIKSSKKRKAASDYEEQFLSIFQSVIRSYLRSVEETGITLSSGLDSLSVGTQAALTLLQQEKKLQAYTYIPATQVSDKTQKGFLFDESLDVLKVCKDYPSINNHFLTNQGKDCIADMDELLQILEIPYKAFPNMASLLEIYKTASADGCKIMLSGQSGNNSISYGDIDSILFHLVKKGHFLKALKRFQGFCRETNVSRKKTFQQIHQYFRNSRQTIKNTNPFDELPDNQFLKKAAFQCYPFEARYQGIPKEFLLGVPFTQSLYQKSLFYEAAHTYLGEIETKLGLATGLVLRDPTRDPRLLEYFNQVPYELFCHLGIPRYFVRSTMKPFIPKEILSNYDRYGVQNSDWIYRLNQNWNIRREQIQTQILGSPLNASFDLEKVEAYLKQHQNELPGDDYENLINLLLLYIISS